MTDRFVTPEPLPANHDQELLTILMEECAEVSIRASKMKRFGVNEMQPGQVYTNKQRLGHKVGDLYYVVTRLMARGLVDTTDIEEGFSNKEKQLSKFLQTEPGP